MVDDDAVQEAAVARGAARDLVASLAERYQRLLSFDGIDLGRALEQQVFFALRDGGGSELRGPLMLNLAAQFVMATAGAVVASHPRPARTRPVVALIRSPAHMAILLAVEEEFRQLTGDDLSVVRVGDAARRRYRVTHPYAPRLAEMLDPALLPELARCQLRMAADLVAATREWPATAAAAAQAELPRIAMAAMALDGAVRRWQPALLLTFDEVGTWARILPAVARRWGIPSLDLPHAEAADPIAIAGLDYDRVAVYGPRAMAVLRAAGVAADKITEIGAPRFDDLHARTSAQVSADPAQPRRVVFAAQYLTRIMSMAALELCHRAALAAAAAVAPSELIVVPHPAERPGLIASVVARHVPPAGVSVGVDGSTGLHPLLEGAWLMVTGWSNSVFEAALAGVPAIAVNPGGHAPVDFAKEGMAITASSEASAAAAAAALLDPHLRARAIARARSALRQHLGYLDGRASERAANLILELAQRTSGDDKT